MASSTPDQPTFPVPEVPRPVDSVEPLLPPYREDVGASYDAVARSVALAVGAERCHLALYDSESSEIIARRPSYGSAVISIPQFRFPVRMAPASARVVITGEPYISNDPARDPLYEPSVKEHGVHCVLTVPVRRGDRVLGLLYALNKPGGFGADDARTLTALAGACAVTLENIRLYADERERRLLSDSLREVSRALLGTSSEDAALAAVLDQMWKVLRYQAALAVLAETDVIRVAASRGGPAGVTVPLEDLPEVASALEARQITVLPDSGAHLRRLGIDGVEGPCLVAPLLTHEDVRGGLLVAFGAGQNPGLQDGPMAGAFADHAALFLDAAAVLRRERQARAREAAVARITRTAASRHDPDSLLQAVAPELLGLAAADRAILYFRHPRRPVAEPAAWAGIPPDEEVLLRELVLDLADPALEPLQRGETVLLQDRASPPPESLAPWPGTGSLLLVPLASREQVGGVVSLSARRWRHFDPALVEAVVDVTRQVSLGVENARLFTALTQMASTDELTQLANRRRFTESLKAEATRARRTGLPLSLIMADIDRLKRINDTFGHPSGDAAIRHVAQALRTGRRENDMVARLGGEEFAILLPATDGAGAVQAAERVRRFLEGCELEPLGCITVSMGVATLPEEAEEEEALILLADRRLYAAKEGGRNRVAASLPADAPQKPAAPV